MARDNAPETDFYLDLSKLIMKLAVDGFISLPFIITILIYAFAISTIFAASGIPVNLEQIAAMLPKGLQPSGSIDANYEVKMIFTAMLVVFIIRKALVWVIEKGLNCRLKMSLKAKMLFWLAITAIIFAAALIADFHAKAGQTTVLLVFFFAALISIEAYVALGPAARKLFEAI
jgi:hypothetical protein